MAEWLAPFHRPHVTTEEFLKRRDAYVARYGYRYSIPGYDDIIKLPYEKPITLEEEKIWRKKDYGKLAPGRYEDILTIKEHRKQQYLDMLGSPMPQIFQNRAALIAAIDDCEDAISTALALGILALKVLPEAIGKLISGPLTWLMSATQVLNMAMNIITPEMSLVSQKRLHDQVTDDNPFSKTARAKNTERLTKHGFHMGTILEAAQVTNSIFGIGVSLGQLMALPETIIAGAARAATGKPVKVHYPVPDLAKWKRRIMKGQAAQPLVNWIPPNPNFQLSSKLMLLHTLSSQILTVDNIGIDPMDICDDMASVQVRAPRPTNFLTLEVINETDPGGHNAVGWPDIGSEWASLGDIVLATAPRITQNYLHYCWTNKRSIAAYACASLSTQATFQTLQNVLGPGTMEYDYLASTKIDHALLNANLSFPQNLKPWQQARMITWLQAHDDAKTCPTLPEVTTYARDVCGFYFRVGPPPSTIEYKGYGQPRYQDYAGIFDQPHTLTYPTIPQNIQAEWRRLTIQAQTKSQQT